MQLSFEHFSFRSHVFVQKSRVIFLFCNVYIFFCSPAVTRISRPSIFFSDHQIYILVMVINITGRRLLKSTTTTFYWTSAVQQRLSSSSSSCTWQPNGSHLLLQRPYKLQTTSNFSIISKRFKFKRVGEDRPLGTELNILGSRYKADEWTNVPEKVLRLIGTELYRRPGNPIFLIAESLRRHFARHRVYHFPDPVVSLWANFDSILVPADHISRSRTDTFYVDAGHVLRGHTSAHQSDCFQWCFDEADNDNGQFLIIGDVYRRDEVNRTHHAAFHQCEVVKLYKEGNEEVSLSLLFS